MWDEQKILCNQYKCLFFDFVPYKFGCFSFQSYADLGTMMKYALVDEEKETNSNHGGYWVKRTPDCYLERIKEKDLLHLKLIKNKFQAFTTEELIKYTYLNYPYYAINSLILERVLTKEEAQVVEQCRPYIEKKLLYTIGYEGISLENYINKLLINGVELLCDVRKNPLSMKYGFSKNQLKTACNRVGIDYLHLPELGIESQKRKELKCQHDYDVLFEEYNSKILKTERSISAIGKVFDLLTNKKRIALTCFEANIHQCHRKHLASSIRAYDTIADFEIVHI